MKIVVLGWGSLIWDPGDLPLAGPWKQPGPVLPVEFSRVSTKGKRAGCLTAVIDEEHGQPVTTWFALSPRGILEEAVEDLRKREGPTVPSNIGYVNLLTAAMHDVARQRHPAACEAIRKWALARRLDAVVWTALESNFKEVVGTPFSVKAAIEYLRSLPEPPKSNALEYLTRAPRETMTPVRQAAIEAGLISIADSEGSPSDDAWEGEEETGEQFPWEHVDQARHNRALQRQHPLSDAAHHHEDARACPKCGKPSSELAWFYFESPQWTWENLCGRAGWMTVCDTCRVQVDFFMEILN